MNFSFKEWTRIDIIAISLITVGFLALIFLPYIVTQLTWLNYFKINWGKPNEIGDMIGGTTGPFIALISAGLIYLTLREQISMNNEFKKRFEAEDVKIFKNDNYKESINFLNKMSLFFLEIDIKDDVYSSYHFRSTDAIIYIFRNILTFGYSENYIHRFRYSQIYFNLILLKNSSDFFIQNKHDLANLKNYYINLQFLINAYIPIETMRNLEEIILTNGDKRIKIHPLGEQLYIVWKNIITNAEIIIGLINNETEEINEFENSRHFFEAFHSWIRVAVIQE